jgi:hypothetical protein
MKKQLITAGIIIVLIIPVLGGCIQDTKVKTAKFRIYLDFHYYFSPDGYSQNETYIVEAHENEYFGVPNTSLLVTNKSFCNISEGLRLFRFVEKIDSDHIKIQFNESALYNYTTRIIGYNPASDPSWELEEIYINNPIIVSTNSTLFFPRVGSFRNFLSPDPNPCVRLYLNITGV